MSDPYRQPAYGWPAEDSLTIAKAKLIDEIREALKGARTMGPHESAVSFSVRLLALRNFYETVLGSTSAQPKDP